MERREYYARRTKGEGSPDEADEVLPVCVRRKNPHPRQPKAAGPPSPAGPAGRGCRL